MEDFPYRQGCTVRVSNEGAGARKTPLGKNLQPDFRLLSLGIGEPSQGHGVKPGISARAYAQGRRKGEPEKKPSLWGKKKGLFFRNSFLPSWGGKERIPGESLLSPIGEG